ncbi:aspartate kinase : Aspartokinase OS=Singulisphaera acidiphila (strain ATCC BAA-1392 / DSM 18658 / VKM B-2454 / MOB10) GN=Sinac_5942 PE=3 SV=1: AA_kinase: ACT: ACT_7: ACT [Gemmata massiliana]|uniref:aspartate kinase n=1 Tax=Gemmata massiliana TaxID=1210884 RepID=A0A6P2D1F4_9BACT|nr:aspartate kinase [Gemmata massiliana]VTR94687.1 aspartate kinase : Aspartokinase OS=Singulisphaera acidiphila (strain ATCC BAA-1392 / DSM 18658 / VKM B-2454 / MOB10) GN=Sinac_5942 PE=3 SV=1: AA_kinase: ACT: ACT_7: ACT [Gemmata massiliana]
MGVVVQKFGGSSVKDAESVMEAARKAIRAKHAGSKVIVVVSAQGSTTDDLIAKAGQITSSPSAREMDMLLATGEQISIALTAMAIHELGERAVSFTGPQIGIVTDSTHRKARIKKIDTVRLCEALDTGHIVVLAGFQGVDELGDISTLGRGGSDTTAVAVAAAVKLAGYEVECEIYTDVDGVYTTDPRIVPDARKMDAISYDEMLEMASMGAGVMHSRSIEFAKKFDVPLMVRNAKSDAIGTWIVPEAAWMSEIPACGVALAADEARLVLEGVPDRPGVSHRVFAVLADANIAVDMIAQSVGEGGKATIGFTVLNTELDRTKKILAPIVAELGAALNETGKVSKVSVVGAGMRYISGVAERMFQALAIEGVNLKMITTGDIKISVLVEEDGAAESGIIEAPTGEPIKKSHLESKKAVRGRRALRAVHAAFALPLSRKGAGEPPASGEFKPRPNPLMVAASKDREAAIARLEGMEDVLVSGVHLNTEQSRVTVHDLPDKPGNCSRVFNAVATGGILVDMIVQNQSGPAKAELSFTVPRADLTRALKRTQDVVREIDPACRVVGDGDIAVLFVLGVGMRTHTGVARTMFGALAAKGINISMINTSEVCVGVVVERARGEEAHACLTEAFKLG